MLGCGSIKQDGRAMKKKLDSSREFRYVSLDEESIEIREEGDEVKVVGYASVFNKLSDDLGFGREKVKRGAFAETIKDDDIRALWNHDSSIVMGRNKSGTLNLSEDRKGLKVEIMPPSSFPYLETIRRGDVTGMSIGFVVHEQKWENLNDDKKETIRTIIRASLFDVSPVTFPAFPDTSVAVRTIEGLVQEERDTQEEIEREAEARKRRLRLLEIA